jgi:hypothetical protein
MLQVSENRRFLQNDNGTPFFLLGDTAWELFHRTTREEADLYLEDRAAKGFTVAFAVAIAEFEGLTVPNSYGDLPTHNLDPTRPNEAYFRHIDYVVNKAESLGMTIGFLPVWGDKVSQGWGKGPEVMTPENAHVYGEWLGKRYADKPIIWVIGGDRKVENERHFATWRSLAAGLTVGDGGRHLKTFHPQGACSSSDSFHNDDWLDFNQIQSSHGQRDVENWKMVEKDYALVPVKPCMDTECPYEGHGVNWTEANGRFSDWDARKGCYWNLFAGAHGHTYGSIDVCLFWRPGLPTFPGGCHETWQEALSLPGSSQMHHAKDLLLARSYFTRIPDQSLIISDIGEGMNHLQATRCSEGSFALVYSPLGNPFTLNLLSLNGDTYSAAWFNPKTGVSDVFGEVQPSAEQSFTPPSVGKDWILVLDRIA